jgi:hypothetical protein
MGLAWTHRHIPDVYRLPHPAGIWQTRRGLRMDVGKLTRVPTHPVAQGPWRCFHLMGQLNRGAFSL